jgi:hypothetical protein
MWLNDQFGMVGAKQDGSDPNNDAMMLLLTSLDIIASFPVLILHIPM